MRHRESRIGVAPAGLDHAARHSGGSGTRPPVLRPDARSSLTEEQMTKNQMHHEKRGPGNRNRHSGAPKGERVDRKTREAPRKRLRV